MMRNQRKRERRKANILAAAEKGKLYAEFLIKNPEVAKEIPTKSVDADQRTKEVLSDPDIMKQINDSNKPGAKSRDFEEVAKELKI